MPSGRSRIIKKPVLVIIYNNPFPGNIEKLEYIYKGRFSHIYHLMPFYVPPKDNNVIPVYDKPDQFQAFVAQGLLHYQQDNVSHYIFCADDLLLNPDINENNYHRFFQLDSKMGCFGKLRKIPYNPLLIWSTSWWWHNTKRIIPYPKLYSFVRGWPHSYSAYLFNPRKDLSEAMHLPDPQGVIHILQKCGITGRNYYSRRGFRLTRVHHFINTCICRFVHKSTNIKILYTILFPILLLFGLYFHFISWLYKLRYPLVRGYSDIFIIPSAKIQKFAYYCGVFASANIFAEIAIPTAYALSEIPGTRLDNLKYKTHDGPWHGTSPLSQRNNDSLDSLIEEFPRNYLYIHPVKLSEVKKSQ